MRQLVYEACDFVFTKPRDYPREVRLVYYALLPLAIPAHYLAMMLMLFLFIITCLFDQEISSRCLTARE